jgi:MFS transporter, AAHS family, 4-hydroxybenzoate transporter
MARTFDVQAVIDGQTSIRPQLPLLAVMTFIMFLDGYDVFMLGRIAPAMADSECPVDGASWAINI